MKILLVSAYFPPEVRSAAQLMRELAETLAQRGHGVTVVTTFPPTNVQLDATARWQVEQYRGRVWLRERVGAVQVTRVATIPFNKMPPMVRALGHFALAASLTLGGLLCGRHEVIWVYSPPLTLGLTSALLGILWRAPYIVNVQDLYPQTLVDLGLLRNRRIIRLLEWLERMVYRRAAAIVVHSPGNRLEIERRGVPSAKIVVIPNWTDTQTIRPADRLNGFRRRYGLGDGIIVLFAGVMGYAQDMDIIVESAARLRHRSEVTFLLVGDGVRRAEAEARVAALEVTDRVRFLPLQSAETYPEVLSAADVCLVTLRGHVRTPVVPSKILGMMAAGRPIVAALPEGNDAVQLISEAGAGVCVPVGDSTAMADAIGRLCVDTAWRAALGARGRWFAETHLDRGVLVARCEALMDAAVHGRR